MALYQFDDDNDGEGVGRWTRIAQIVVRGLGMVLLLVGLWIALAVISEAWSLYQDPQKIERLAKAIEHGSNLDRTLSTASSKLAITADETTATTPPRAVPVQPDPELGFRMTYFVAWVVAVLLLMLCGRLAIAAVKTGGELVLYDMQIKRFARELVNVASGKLPR
ncbi:MAG: hypothetical protein HYX63_19890 [Gammaproteobacteria bacterium]|nr:hypothetical protein [Gammaproteobacteria bacterium]